MLFTKSWRSGTAALVTVGLTSITLLPLLTSVRAAIASPITIAQVFSQPSQMGIPAGTVIPITYREAEKIVLTPEETTEVNLIVESDIRTARGTVLIPAGSQIAGQLQPAEDGTQFVASELILANGRRYPIEATSEVVTRTETITERSNPDFLRGAAIGAAAAAVLSEVLGDIDLIEVLAGAGLGALASVLMRGDKEVEVVVVYPETDLDLRLESNFALSTTSFRSTP